jgi:hypothetical protein
MRRLLSIVLAALLLVSFRACSAQGTTGTQEVADVQELANITMVDQGDYAAIVWDGRTYVPYTAIAKKDCGKQIGILDDDKNDKVYAYKDYSTEMWIAEMYISGEMDGPMLYREINVTDIPEGLQSEYEWNQ